MDPRQIERFRLIEELFDAALQHPPGPARDAFLRDNAAGGEDVTTEVRKLIEDLEQVRSAAPEEPEALPRFGPWQGIRLLGRGGMGAVYLAKRADGAFQMSAAVKVVPLALASHDIEERFRRERQFLASLDHPGIARLIDGGVTAAGLPFLVMEFVDGLTIDRYCQSRGLQSRSIVELVRQVLEALTYVHGRGVIHRDVKPSNILVDSSGNAKLLDFGTARLVDATGDAAITQTGVFAFTPEYASPEQVTGKTPSYPSDVYSAGVLLYRLLTGRAPYKLACRSPGEIAEMIGRTAPDPAELGDPPLETILSRALRKNPEERYPAVAEMDADLERYLAGEPVHPSRPQRPNWIAIAALSIALAVAAPGVGWWLTHRSNPVSGPVPIAVLPFTNVSSEKAGQYFADALTQEASGELTHNKALRLSPQASAAVFRKMPRDLPYIGRKLNVSYLLEASVERAGDRVKIVAALERASNGAKLWANTYQRRTADLGAIEADLAAAVASTLRVAPPDPRKTHVPPEQARDYYLKGSFELNQQDPQSNASAQLNLRRALELDPEYASAYNSLASAIWNRNIVAGERPVIEERRQSEKLWRKALEINPDMSGPRISLALYAMQYDWDWKRAERELQTVLAAGPNSQAEDKLSTLYLIQGRRAEAERHRRLAQDLDNVTFSLSSNNMTFLALEGRFAEARQECLKLIARNSRAIHWQVQLASLDASLGDKDAAIRNLRQLSQREPDAVITLAEVEAAAGHREQALRLLLPLERNYQTGKLPMSEFAIAYAAMGDEPNTVKWLERAMEAREMPTIYMHVEPAFAKMQDTPEFHRLKQRMNLDW